jgi:hypothetical protein
MEKIVNSIMINKVTLTSSYIPQQEIFTIIALRNMQWNSNPPNTISVLVALRINGVYSIGSNGFRFTVHK